MKWPVYRLHFKAPLHIGEEGIGAEKIVPYIPSDTLWGALASAHITLGLPFDFEQPAFTISSAFPFVQDCYFFPVPLGGLDDLLTQAAAKDEAALKDLKKVLYLEQTLFEQIICGVTPDLEKLFLPEKQKTFLLSNAQRLESFPIFRIFEVPRVTVDRFHSSAAEGQIFYFSQMVFGKQAGLFFLANFKDDQTQNNMEAALRFLGDEGLGADRTVGRGFFSVEKAELELKIPENPDSFTTLSLFYPRIKEIQQLLQEKARYRLIKRKGFAAHVLVRGKRRGMVRMFAEGSVFPLPADKQTPGTNPCVIKKDAARAIPFNVYRYGQAFAIPVRFAEEGT